MKKIIPYLTIFFSLSLFFVNNLYSQTDTLNFEFEDGLPDNWEMTGSWFINNGNLSLAANPDSSILGTVTSEVFNFSDYDSVTLNIPYQLDNPDNASILIDLLVSIDGGMTFVSYGNILSSNPAEIDISDIAAGEPAVVIQLFAEGYDFNQNILFETCCINTIRGGKKYDISTADAGKGISPQKFSKCYPINKQDTLYIKFSNNNTIDITIMSFQAFISIFNINYNISNIPTTIYDANNTVTYTDFNTFTTLTDATLSSGSFMELSVPVTFNTTSTTPYNIGRILPLHITFCFTEGPNSSLVCYQDSSNIQIGLCCQDIDLTYNDEPLPPFTGVAGHIEAGNVEAPSYYSGDTINEFGVQFQAGEYISLESGFKTNPGAIFSATIEPNCITDSIPNNAKNAEIEKGEIIKISTKNEHLLSIFPNPMRDQTHIYFEVEETGPVTLIIYDYMGKPYRQLIQNTVHEKGKYTIKVDVSNLPSGSYILKAFLSNKNVAKRFIKVD